MISDDVLMWMMIISCPRVVSKWSFIHELFANRLLHLTAEDCCKLAVKTLMLVFHSSSAPASVSEHKQSD